MTGSALEFVFPVLNHRTIPLLYRRYVDASSGVLGDDVIKSLMTYVAKSKVPEVRLAVSLAFRQLGFVGLFSCYCSHLQLEKSFSFTVTKFSNWSLLILRSTRLS